jgi:hypothetical protein
MKDMIKKHGNIPIVKLFVVFLIILNFTLALMSTPISDSGDTFDYIQLSKVLLGQEHANLGHRSPLYSIMLAGLMIFFNPPILFKVAIFFQYFLVGITSWLIYNIFRPLFSRCEPAILISLMFNLSLSTIYFANIILTEVLSVFLLVLSVYFILDLYRKFNYFKLITLGITVGLLSLARFNVLPITATFFILLMILLIKQQFTFLKIFLSIFAFIFSYSIIINIWCIYNFENNNFYGLFPTAGSGYLPRNVIVSSIQKDNTVSEINKPILEIFIRAKQKYSEMTLPQIKGSWIKYDKAGIIEDLYGGFQIYLLARPELRNYFHLNDNEGEYELDRSLADFYKEIYHLNSKYMFKMRLLSFLSGFRAAPSALQDHYGKINTNILPSFILSIFKIIIPSISLFIFFSLFPFTYKLLVKQSFLSFPLLVFYFVVFSFWFINFYFITVGDADRFKFPAEPFIFGLFVYYLSQFLRNFISNSR